MPLRARNIIFAPGLFGWGPPDEMNGVLPYWGDARAQLDGGAFRIHEAKVGPVSSFHDRACELYAQIRGRRVDYGEAHSRAAGHDRYSPTLTFEGRGFVEGWSADNPVILIGHSAGAQTCLILQQLLREGLWNAPGDETSADWIEVVVSVAGVLNGSTLPYMFGCDKSSGALSRGLSPQAISSLIKLANAASAQLEYAPGLVSLWLDHWAGAADEARSAAWFEASPFVTGTDNLAYDLTLQGCRKANDRFEASPNTYYLSLVTGATRAPPVLKTIGGAITRLFGLTSGPRAIPDASMLPLLLPSALYQASVSFDAPPIPGWGAGDLTLDAWSENDGAVSSISQRYPFTGQRAASVAAGGFMEGRAPERGKWCFERIETVSGLRFDHLDPVFGISAKSRALREAHQTLWRKLGERLATL
jgi:hypothetical protein